jgi:hypothetical protein
MRKLWICKQTDYTLDSIYQLSPKFCAEIYQNLKQLWTEKSWTLIEGGGTEYQHIFNVSVYS